MLYLKPNPSLLDFQNYVAQLELERGFASEALVHKGLFLSEELGEVFELIEQPLQHKLIAHELADLLIFPCSIAARRSISLDEALQQQKGIALATPLAAVQEQLGTPTAPLTSLGLQMGIAVGKLCKAIRKLENLKMGTHSKEVILQVALIDTIVAICLFANRANVNLEQAFRAKEEINKTRVWLTQGNAEVTQ